MSKSKFDIALEYGNYLYFYLEQPSKYLVIITKKNLQNAVDKCRDNIGKKDYIFSFDGIDQTSTPLYFRSQQDLNLFKLITSRDSYAEPKKEKDLIA